MRSWREHRSECAVRPRPMVTGLVDGRVGVGRRRTGRDHAEEPIAVVLEGVEDVLSVGVHQIGPRLPQRVDDVVDEADLPKKPTKQKKKKKKEKRTKMNEPPK